MSNDLHISLREFIHRPVIHLMRINYMQKYRIVPIKCNIENILQSIDGAGIFVANHSNCHDIPILLNAIGQYTMVVFAIQNTEIQDAIGLFLNGKISVDRKCKKSCRMAKQEMIRVVNEGVNTLIFSEATWNLSKSSMMLPMYWGVIDVARETGRPIIPTILDYKFRECRIRFGDPFYVDSNISKQEAFDLLEEKMCTIRWELWQLDPIVSRKDTCIEGLASYIVEWPNEYPKLDLAYEKSVILKRELSDLQKQLENSKTKYLEAMEPIYKLREEKKGPTLVLTKENQLLMI